MILDYSPLSLRHPNPDRAGSEPQNIRTREVSMKITRRIHLNPQSKGSLGKSFETEFRVAWLDWLEIPWTGSDLDDRHRFFRDFEDSTRRLNQIVADLQAKPWRSHWVMGMLLMVAAGVIGYLVAFVLVH